MNTDPARTPDRPVADPWADWVGGTSHDRAPAPAKGSAGDGTGDATGTTDADHATYGADDVLADQLDAYGAVANSSDGTFGADGTGDYDWT